MNEGPDIVSIRVQLQATEWQIEQAIRGMYADKQKDLEATIAKEVSQINLDYLVRQAVRKQVEQYVLQTVSNFCLPIRNSFSDQIEKETIAFVEERYYSVLKHRLEDKKSG